MRASWTPDVIDALEKIVAVLFQIADLVAKHLDFPLVALAHRAPDRDGYRG